MIVLGFILQLTAAVTLLLFAIWMIRKGVEETLGSTFRRLIITRRHSVLLIPVGVSLAFLLQSSAAVILLVTELVASGVLNFGLGMALVLGADLGSALLIQVLALEVEWLLPMLLAPGGLLFLRSRTNRTRQIGRILLGIGFVLIALGFLRDAVEPLQNSAVLPAVSIYMERDYLTAFIIGGGLAFLMHSSVAVVLICVALVSLEALSLQAGISLVLGCNLGSALIPIWLTRRQTAMARRLPLANLVIRGGLALPVLAIVNSLESTRLLIAPLSPPQSLILFHIGFNALLILALPALGLVERFVTTLLPFQSEKSAAGKGYLQLTLLDQAMLERPTLALSCLRREVMRMAAIVEEMFTPLMQLYQLDDADTRQQIISRDSLVNDALDGIRDYGSALTIPKSAASQRQELRELMDYAIALEAAGDIIVKRLLPLTEQLHDAGSLSQQGYAELAELHRQIKINQALATNFLVKPDVTTARVLIEEKANIKKMEQSSRKAHLKRLRKGNPESQLSSDIHLETAYLMKEFHSWIVSVAHPVLENKGQLMETRLISEGQPAK